MGIIGSSAKIDGTDAARDTMARPPAATRNSSDDRSATPAGPLYRQVVQALQQEIVNGVYPVDSQLPTEDELRQRFKVSRHTIREALRALRDAGLVESRQGFGTTVLRPGAPRPYVHEVASINALIEPSSAASNATGKALSPYSPATSLAPRPFTSATVTRAPSSIRRLTTARPIRPAAPVTMATLSVNPRISNS